MRIEIINIYKKLFCENAFRNYSEELFKIDDTVLSKCIAIDGKALRGSFDNFIDKKAVHILNVFATCPCIILANKETEEKSNEIPAVQELLVNAELSGYIMTLDAMHCQKETCKKIIAKHGNYVFGLKENQKTLHDDVKFFFDEEFDSKTLDSYTTVEKNGGRIEKRICKKCSDI